MVMETNAGGFLGDVIVLNNKFIPLSSIDFWNETVTGRGGERVVE